MRKRNYLLPNTFTALNLFSGFLAVINAANGQFVSAAWLIVLAALFDAFDGRVARSTQTFSRFGTEADSLADMVSFGVAPAFLAYQIGLVR
ncbi:MAG TPA: CDP-diacylglycerol--serine O-phosphatidyltransferase, partial [Bacteroidetes bacterium]|nr:CDP-diacylglycerol--serine O-phosphatidyltransferase [Bacteroidota bacterium]